MSKTSPNRQAVRAAFNKASAAYDAAASLQQEVARRLDERKQIALTMKDIIDILPEWITNQDPRQVKYYVGKVVSLTAHPDGRIVAEWL